MAHCMALIYFAVSSKNSLQHLLACKTHRCNHAVRNATLTPRHATVCIAPDGQTATSLQCSWQTADAQLSSKCTAAVVVVLTALFPVTVDQLRGSMTGLRVGARMDQRLCDNARSLLCDVSHKTEQHLWSSAA